MSKMKMKGTRVLKGVAAMSLGFALVTAAVQDASAFGRDRLEDIRDDGPAETQTAPAPAPVVVAEPAPAPTAGPAGIDGDISLDDAAEGYALGQRNGGILVRRLKLATIGSEAGCSAIGELESALLKVARKIHAPASGSEALTLGFFRGYLDAIREGVRETRQGCDALAYEDEGLFAGSLYGAVLCSVTSVSLDLATRLEVVPLYAGWSGGKSEVLAGCRTSLELTVRECAGLEALSAFELSISNGCAH